MTIRPEEGPEYGQEIWQPGGTPPGGRRTHAEEELDEHEREGQEVNYLDPEDNELHAAGQVCQRCGTVINATQDVRLLPDGHWVHEVCPVHPS